MAHLDFIDMANSTISPKTLAGFLEPIIKTSPLFKGQNLYVHIIANPHAGGFAQYKVAQHNYTVLEKAAREAKLKPEQVEKITVTLHATQKPGHATIIANDLINDLLSLPLHDRHRSHTLIVTAGGDGTHLEAQTALLKEGLSSDSDRDLITTHVTLLRMPFGTGNDGSDGRTVEESLLRLTSPAHFALQRAIKVWYSGLLPDTANSHRKIDHYESLSANPPWYAFNIASIGIDAFITYMTNKTKRVMPGDTYQLWVDLACLFYGINFPFSNMVIDTFRENGKLIKTYNTPIEFCLLGVSGHRTYGSNHKILPNTDNFCMAPHINMIKKMLIKNLFDNGDHVDSPYVSMHQAHKITINGSQDILVQMDGEVHLITPSCYPLHMERTKPIIRIIELDSEKEDRGTVRC